MLDGFYTPVPDVDELFFLQEFVSSVWFHELNRYTIIQRDGQLYYIRHDELPTRKIIFDAANEEFILDSWFLIFFGQYVEPLKEAKLFNEVFDANLKIFDEWIMKLKTTDDGFHLNECIKNAKSLKFKY